MSNIGLVLIGFILGVIFQFQIDWLLWKSEVWRCRYRELQEKLEKEKLRRHPNE